MMEERKLKNERKEYKIFENGQENKSFSEKQKDYEAGKGIGKKILLKLLL